MKRREPLPERAEYFEALRPKEEKERASSCTNAPHQWYLHDIQFKYIEHDDAMYEVEVELVGHYYILHCKTCHEMRRLNPAEMKIFSSHFEIDGYKETKTKEE